MEYLKNQPRKVITKMLSQLKLTVNTQKRKLKMSRKSLTTPNFEKKMSVDIVTRWPTSSFTLESYKKLYDTYS